VPNLPTLRLLQDFYPLVLHKSQKNVVRIKNRFVLHFLSLTLLLKSIANASSPEKLESDGIHFTGYATQELHEELFPDNHEGFKKKE
jgi:lysophospholipase L1-like esterase